MSATSTAGKWTSIRSACIWLDFVPGVEPGAAYKYHIRSRYDVYRVDKTDAFAFFTETPPLTASRVRTLISNGATASG